MSSVAAQCGVYRRPSIIESAAAGLGARLLSWSEKRRFIPADVLLQNAAIARREHLGQRRADAVSAAHSGLEPRV